MRKLAMICVSIACAVFLSYYYLPLPFLLPAGVVCAAAALPLFLMRRRNRLITGGALVLLGAALGFLAYPLHWNATMRFAQELDGTEQTMTVRLMETPSEGDHYTRLHVKQTGAPGLSIMLYDYREERETAGMRPGDLLTVNARLRRADLRYGERNASYVSKDIYLTGTLRELESAGRRSPTLRTAAAACSSAVSDFAGRLFSPDTAVFMKALLLGDKNDFYRDTVLYARMRGAGLMHVVAVSGMHIAFLVGMIQLLFGARPATTVWGILLVWFFVFMTGASPSAVRAGIMQSILLLAPVFRRENDGLTSLSVALAVILLVNPFSVASVSLQMSFSAMAGMVLLADPLTGAFLAALGLPEESRLRGPMAALAGTLAVLIFSAPVTVLHFGTLAVYSPLTNLLCLWAVSLCFCGGWLACAAGWLLPWAGSFLAMLPELLARYLMLVAGLICRLPHHLVAMQRADMKLWLLLCYVLALLAWRSRAGVRLRVFVPVGLGLLTLAVSLWGAGQRYRSADGVIAALDVGQGECVCVLSGDTTLMFDCGGLGTLENAGETAATWLEAAGRERIDTLVLSHLHADHCNGVPMLLELIPVDRIIFSPNADFDEEFLPAITEAAERHSVKLSLLTEDTQLDYGTLRAALYAPPDDASENERCIISLVSVSDYDMLFTADSPKKAELQLLADHELPDTELLIVGHHGSYSASDSGFLSAIGAEKAIISVGYNSYGHPTREVLARLQACGYETYRTDKNGTVEVWVNAS